MFFGPKSKRFFYVGVDENFKNRAVIDGKEENPFNFISNFFFTVDGKYHGYIGRKHKVESLFKEKITETAMINGNETVTYPKILEVDYNTGNEQFAFVVGDKQSGGKQFVVYNDKEGEKFDEIIINPYYHKGYIWLERKYLPTFFENNEKIVYIGRRKLVDPKNQLAFVINHKLERKWYEEIRALAFSPDRNHYAFSCLSGKRWTLINDGKEIGDYKKIAYQGLKFSPDNQKLACIVQTEKGWVVMVNGKEGKPYDKIQNKIYREWWGFSPDSSRLIYKAKKGKKWVVVVGGKESPLYDEIDTLKIFREGGHLIYKGKKGKQWVFVMDGKEHNPYDEIGTEYLIETREFEKVKQTSFYNLNVVISPDGKHLAYAARVGKKWTVVMDEKEGEQFLEVDGLTFSPDSKHLVYSAKVDKNNWIVVVNGETGGEKYDKILVTNLRKVNIFKFDGTDTFYFMALKNNGIYLIKQNLIL